MARSTTSSEHDAAPALRRLPSLDAFLQRQRLRALPRPLALRTARDYLDELRRRVLDGSLAEADLEGLLAGSAADDEVVARCGRASERHHRAVINATGVVLHTGIGRAPLAQAARDAIAQAAGYAIVEVDPDSGERNQREDAVAALLGSLTGAAGALVVNNNAAATTLMLAALAAGREVVVSRGQLVEIGGGFRMPEVMAQAGCRLVEVGTTNRTHLRDYQRAIGPQTAALLLVHPSNFRVLGFTAQPERAEVAALGRAHGVAVLEDLGSGLLLQAPPSGLADEPRVHDVLAGGVGLLCFSGDKLLGGPQCGIAVGGRELVARLRAHPLYRAFRCDKLTLAALEATLRIYRDGDPLADIPALRMLAAPASRLEERARALARALQHLGAVAGPSESYAGSGAVPARPLPSFAVSLPGGEPRAAALRAPSGGPPIFTRIERDRVLLDLRTLEIEDLDEVARLVAARVDGISLQPLRGKTS